MKVRCVRGMHDLLPDQAWCHHFLIETIFSICSRFGYRRVGTPIVEHTALFHQMLGQHTDVIHKEMYAFQDQGGEEIALRPEGTAGIARAFAAMPPPPLPWKVAYAGPMFRRERPQKGRLRQFHQAGVEMIGLRDPRADAEIIAMAADALAALKLNGKTVLKINSLGGGDSRRKWRTALQEYFQPQASRLSADSQRRLTQNPLRILDSKDAGDREICAAAPKIGDFLTKDEGQFFERVQHHLKRLDVPFTLEPHLVRGLDYYSDTAFEFENSALGSQATVLAGGRYDSMLEMLGAKGESAAGIGWAAGVERLALICDVPNQKPPLARVAAAQSDWEDEAFEFACYLRRQGVHADYSFGGNLGKILRRASSQEVRFAVIFADEEHRQQRVILRDLATGSQSALTRGELVKRLQDVVRDDREKGLADG